MSTTIQLSKYTKHGPFGSPNIRKTSCNITEEDLAFMHEVFPEWGTQSNVPGYLLARFCDALREDGIISAEARRASPHHYDVLSAIDTFLAKPRAPLFAPTTRLPLPPV